MILRSLDIGSFAGLSDRHISFGEGLTIISGPNEAGKSTIFSAILHTLFTPSSPGKRRFEKELARFLPLAGGDTIQCTLTFEAEEPYTLERSWGGESRDVLRLPDGGVVRDAAAVDAVLRDLLPVSEGTMKNVFLVYQNRLQRTLEDMKEFSGTGEELGSVIRRSFFETGGLSVERFRALLDTRYEEYAGRWDFDRDGPEGGRGVENPWKSGAGTIVKNWYVWKRLEADRDEARRLEAERAGLAEEFAGTEKELENLKAHLAEYKDLFQAMKNRESVTISWERACELRDRHRAAMESWTRLETEIEADRREMVRLDGVLAVLEEERRSAEAAAAAAEEARRLKELKALKAIVESAAADLEAAPKADDDTVRRLRSAERDAGRLSGALAGGDLRLIIRGRAEATITAAAGTGDKREISLSPGSEETLEAGGYAEIETDTLSITAVTGALDVAALRSEYSECIARRDELLKTCGAATIEEAEQASLTRSGLENRLRQAREALDRALDDDVYEELEAEVTAAGEGYARPLKDVLQDAAEGSANRTAAVERVRRREEEIARLVETYKDRDGVMKDFSRAAVDAERLFQEMEGCGEVPAGYEDPQAFTRDYEEKENRRRHLEEDWYRFRERMLELEREMGDESEEELSGRCSSARAEFQRSLRTGKYLRTIRGRTEEILETLDGDTFGVYADGCAGYMRALTSDVYGKVDLQGSLPTGASGDGPTVPFPLLSAGTKDIFALAVRLAAADIFLDGRQGFLVLDDPLVDLDPRRRQKAAAVIEAWAAENQVLLFTCHPEYVTLFSSPAIIDLKTPDSH